jgi:tetratricopeptide (TPR) repeat protein
MFRTWCVLAVLACACLTAFAEEPDAKTLFTRGRASYALGRYAEAAELFEKAFELKQDPAILYNAAQAHRLAGDKKKALVLYQSYLRLFGEQQNSTDVERRIADLKAAIEAEQAAKTNPPTGLLNDKPEPTPSSSTEPKPALAAPEPTVAPSTPTVVAQPMPPPKKPLAKRGWFWGVVVGSALVVGGGVALGVVLGTGAKDPAVTLGSVKAN